MLYRRCQAKERKVISFLLHEIKSIFIHRSRERAEKATTTTTLIAAAAATATTAARVTQATHVTDNKSTFE